MLDRGLLSVIIPMYNEEEVVHESYRRLGTVLDRIDLNYELIFVIDSSKDNTMSLDLRTYIKQCFAAGCGTLRSLRNGLSRTLRLKWKHGCLSPK